jgi:hypothetical protein
LRSHEAAKNSRTSIVGRESAEEIDIERFEIEPLEKTGELRHPGELARDFADPCKTHKDGVG